MDITKFKFRVFGALLALVLVIPVAQASVEKSLSDGAMLVPTEIDQLQQKIELELGAMESLTIIEMSEQLNQKGLTASKLLKMKSQLAPDMERIKRSAARIQRWNLLVTARWKRYESTAAYKSAIEANKEMNFVLDNTLAIYLRIGDLTEGLIDIYDARTGITDSQYEMVSKAVGIFELEQRLSL